MGIPDRIDWTTGIWNRNPGKTSALEVLIAGDWAPIRNFSDILIQNPEAVYGDLLPVLRESHLRIVNLECPLTATGAPVVKSGSVFKGLPEHLQGMTVVPFEIVTLGNNHVFDYGIEGFVATRDLLLSNGIHFTGAGLCLAEAQTPVRLTRHGIRIGVISFGEGEDLTAARDDQPGVLGWEIERIIDGIRDLRSRVHVIIVICHGGVEYIPFPPPYLVKALQRIAESGADLVIGHHPHVPQGIQIHNGVPICYSLGNFVFFQPVDLLYRKIGYLIRAGLTQEGLESLRIIPYAIGAERLRLLKGETLKRCLKKLESLSEPLFLSETLEAAWAGFLKYYGKEGFQKEMAEIMGCFEKSSLKGAAMFRNRMTTLQHFHHLTALMTRIMEGRLEEAPAWAVGQVAEYFSRKVGDGFAE